MMYLFAMLLVMSPIRPTLFAKIVPFNAKQFRQVYVLMELYSKDEYIYDESPQEQINEARHRYRELRHAPAIAEANSLPEHHSCRLAQDFYGDRINHIEKCIKLYGKYRYVDFEDYLEFAKESKRYWAKCEEATNENNTYLTRRRALMWLRDTD